MQVVTLDGFLSRHVGVNIAADLAPLNPLAVTSATGWNAWPKWLDGRIDRQVAGLGPYVVAGFSAGATAAARLAERDANCVGLLFISGKVYVPLGAKHRHGLYSMGRIQPRWDGFPAMCLATDGENSKLVDGSEDTCDCLDCVGCNVEFKLAPNPGTHKWPHLAGVAHHLPEIRAFMDKHFGGVE